MNVSHHFANFNVLRVPGLWVALTRSGHVESSGLKKRHAKAFDVLREEAAKNGSKAVRPFVLYSLRHTFLTRLGESGCDAWTLSRLAGHSNVSISSRCSPFREHSAHCNSEPGWAQNWAHFESHCNGRHTTTAPNSIKIKEKYGGRDRVRTCDPLLAKQVLSQLSYTPTSGYYTSFSISYAAISNASFFESFGALGATVFGMVNP